MSTLLRPTAVPAYGGQPDSFIASALGANVEIGFETERPIEFFVGTRVQQHGDTNWLKQPFCSTFYVPRPALNSQFCNVKHRATAADRIAASDRSQKIVRFPENSMLMPGGKPVPSILHIVGTISMDPDQSMRINRVLAAEILPVEGLDFDPELFEKKDTVSIAAEQFCRMHCEDDPDLSGMQFGYNFNGRSALYKLFERYGTQILRPRQSVNIDGRRFRPIDLVPKRWFARSARAVWNCGSSA